MSRKGMDLVNEAYEPSDTDEEMAERQAEKREKVARRRVQGLYKQAQPIAGIKSKSIELMIKYDKWFVDALETDEFFRSVVAQFLKDPNNHQFVENSCKRSLLRRVVDDYDRRADLCSEYATEVTENKYGKGIIEKVDEEVKWFKMHLAPLVLTKQDVAVEGKLVGSVYDLIAGTYKDVCKSYRKIAEKLESLEEDSDVEEEDNIEVDLEDETVPEGEGDEEGSKDGSEEEEDKMEESEDSEEEDEDKDGHEDGAQNQPEFVRDQSHGSVIPQKRRRNTPSKGAKRITPKK